MPFKGVIIEESLNDNSVLKDVEIIKTRVEPVTERHKTPWIKQWTMHDIKVSDVQAGKVAQKISQVLDTSHGNWYADYKSADHHYIIFKDKVFYVDRRNQAEYDQVKDYGISLGIPDYQVDFKAIK